MHKAAHQNYAPAMNNIGILMKEKGKFGKALNWLIRAGDLGDGDAYFQAAKMLVSRNENIKTAISILEKAILSDSITEAGLEDSRSLLRTLRSDFGHIKGG